MFKFVAAMFQLAALAALIIFGYCVWQAVSITGNDVWGERAVATFILGVLFYTIGEVT